MIKFDIVDRDGNSEEVRSVAVMLAILTFLGNLVATPLCIRVDCFWTCAFELIVERVHVGVEQV